MDYELMEFLMRCNQNQKYHYAKAFLSMSYGQNKVLCKPNAYIYVEGNIPICLIAHLDTVFEKDKNNAELFYDERKGVMFCPFSPGFDDACGLYSIFKIIEKDLRPYVLLCYDEEKGGLGAQIAAKQLPPPPVSYLLELDRAGRNNVAFYECGNTAFQEYILSFGFEEQLGTYSDISFISPIWNIASANLGIGYYYEHTRYELLSVNDMEQTIDKTIELLRDAANQPFYTYE